MSKKAKVVLEENMVYHEWENLVEKILGPNGKSVCPFEKLADEISKKEEIYERIRALQRSLNVEKVGK
jgi:hypothetical protein